jgi:prepilin-type N-terminal cleavage/methylation domain-containing protein
MSPVQPRRAFTLIELLAGLGVIALLAGLLGWALRDGSPTDALESAQATVASLLDAARREAVLNQSRAMLVVDADPADERFLRAVHVAVETAPDSGLWRFADDGVALPRGIYFVPGSSGVPGATLIVAEGSAGMWPATRLSSFTVLPAASLGTDAANSSGPYLSLSAPLTAAGLPGAGGGDKIVLAMARRTAAGVVFDHPEWVRGVVLSSYGMAILVNDAPGFDF